MSPDRWERVSACLDALIDRSREEQSAYLAELRDTDPALCAEVESLLGTDSVSRRLETPPMNLLEAASGVQTKLSPRRESPRPQTAGRFQLHEEIARGGMGAVYRATDPNIQRTLAVKVLLAGRADPEAEARFVREARITGRLQHPGVPPVHELGHLGDGTPFFAMKLIEGRTLSALVISKALPSGDQLLGVFEQICHTVAYAHSRRTLHRDLKPNNVMVGAFGEVQVMDWGIAKELDAPEAPTTGGISGGTAEDSQTRDGDVRGTPAYMAPEQARGETDTLDERCDVFGLGGILCALLTGRPPFDGSSWEMMQRSRAGDLSGAQNRLSESGADPALLEIARKCLAPNKHDRYRDAGELAEAVTAYRESVRQKLEQAERERHTAQVQVDAERRRRWLAITLGSALLVVLLLGLGFVTRFWLLADDRRVQAENAQTLAEERREQAEAAQQNLKIERDRTAEAARQARQAVKDSFVLASEHPEFQKDGMQEARRLLLDKALAYFRDFTAQRGNDPGLREDLADAHKRVADILEDRGQLQDALAEFARAIEQVEQLHKDQPTEPRWPLELANLHRLRGGAQLSLGRRDEARASLSRSRELFKSLPRTEPANFEYQFADAQLVQSVGHIDLQEGKLPDALAAYTKSLDLATKLYESGFKKVKVAALAAGNLVSAGHVLKDQRKPAEAEAHYQRALRPLEDLLAAIPGPHYRSELARVYGSLAIVQSDQGQTEKALQSSRRAIELREQLVAANPRVMDYRQGLGTSYLNFADDLREAAARTGKTDPDTHAFREKALKELLALTKLAPDQVSYRHSAASAHLAVAMSYRRDLKQPEKAREHLTAARDVWRALDKQGLATPEHRFTLAECEKQFGLLLLGTDFPKAAEHFRHALALLEQVRTAAYKPDACRCEIARNTTNLAVVAQETAKFDEALKLQAQALDMIETLSREKPKDAEFLRSAKFTRTNMVELGKLAVQKTVTPPPKGATGLELLPHHQARLAKWRQLIEDFPKMPEYRAEAANESVRIAGLHAAAFAPGNPRLAEVIAALKQAQELGFTDAKKLEADPAFTACRNEPEFQLFLKTLK